MSQRYTCRQWFALVVFMLGSAGASLAPAATRVPGPLVDTAWLAGQLGNTQVVVIDVRDDPANFDRPLSDKDLVDEKTGTFLPRQQLAALAGDAGIGLDRESISYCNTGHLASGAWFVQSELLGNNKARLFDGSMHEWTKNAARPLSIKWEMQ